MDLSRSLETFFREQVGRAFADEGIVPGELTEHYLVQLLAAYGAQPIEERPLALLLLGAVTEAPHERRAHLREVGDTSLFLSGFWGDSLGTARTMDVDYYIAMGGTAYGELAGSERSALADVFADLARNFARFVEVLMTIRRRTTRAAHSDRDLVRLYERWLRTKSGWAARRLAEEGVMPALAGALPARGTLH